MLWPDFKCFFFLEFEARSTHIRRLLLDTRHSAAFPVVFRPYRRKYWSCVSPELGAWSLRARESLLSNCAWRSCSAFAGRAWLCLGSTASNLLLGASGVGACSLPFFPLSATCIWVFLPLCYVFPLFPRYSLSLYCINFTKICVG